MPIRHDPLYSIIICDECGREQETGLRSLDDLHYWMEVHGWRDRIRDDGDHEYLCGGCRDDADGA